VEATFLHRGRDPVRGLVVGNEAFLDVLNLDKPRVDRLAQQRRIRTSPIISRVHSGLSKNNQHVPPAETSHVLDSAGAEHAAARRELGNDGLTRQSYLVVVVVVVVVAQQKKPAPCRHP
jgi:hypothetical protein